MQYSGDKARNMLIPRPDQEQNEEKELPTTNHTTSNFVSAGGPPETQTFDPQPPMPKHPPLHTVVSEDRAEGWRGVGLHCQSLYTSFHFLFPSSQWNDL